MNIKQKIEKWVMETLKIDKAALVHPKELKNGDYTLIVNDATAEADFEKLNAKKIDEISQIQFIKPRFINIYLSKNFFAESVAQINKEKEKFGETKLLEDQKIIVEHTQPNPFKEFHIGHLMNNAIGESIYRILKLNKADVKSARYHGDKGLHVAKAVWAIQKGIEYEKAYSYGNKAYEEDESAKQEITALNKDIYEGKTKDVWKICADGIKKFEEHLLVLCKRLGTEDFGYKFWETISGEVGKKIVLDNIGKVFDESEGAIIFKGEDFEPKTHTRVFINKDGIPTYEAKEVGLAKIKRELFKYNQSITITASEQDAFFQVVEVAIGEIFPELKGKLKHLSHGMLRLPSGKMSSRTGNIITAESLIDQVKEKVLEKIKDREFDEAEKKEIAEVVAIGAIKYSILRQAIGGDIIFDFGKSISFEGDSGPYLQYTAVRANSVLANFKNLTPDPSPKGRRGGEERPEGFEVQELERVLYRFPEVVERAGREYAPHHLVTYLTELASLFNSFYAKEKIIDEFDPASPYKVSLTQAVAHTLQNGLHLLGIKVPKRM